LYSTPSVATTGILGGICLRVAQIEDKCKTKLTVLVVLLRHDSEQDSEQLEKRRDVGHHGAVYINSLCLQTTTTTTTITTSKSEEGM